MSSRAEPPADHPFVRRLANAWPPVDWSSTSTLIALSGGLDSVALLCGLRALQPKRDLLSAAHVHHGLRGDDADLDEQFCRDLCSRLGIRYVSHHIELLSRASASIKGGLEATARQERYRLLIATAEKLGARYLACGHHADDQIETVLHHVARGTGLQGLSGIPRVRVASPAVTIVRPLLEFRRQEILDYLHCLGQDYRTDLTNRQLDFTRNRIRHELLPWLREHVHPGVDESVLRLSNTAREIQQCFEQLVEPLIDQFVTMEGSDQESIVRILVAKQLIQQPRHLLRELFVTIWRDRQWPLQAMTYDHWQQLVDLLVDSSPRQQTLPGSLHAQRNDDHVELRGRR